ncbi:unnamed protein product [Ceutorhynchus assimilis]|uniref:Sensory neuron membrane protein 1 n=1 Tax=Ceutorhynchus assimilis TaxID=467358 RepID=A0A9N9MDX7_9CUCU|nr:unnamed protein product [Ceutorhynchus assimilis]
MVHLKKLLFILFPNLRLVQVAVKSTKSSMRFPAKLATAAVCVLAFDVLVLFVGVPKLIKSQIKKMVNLKPGVELRDMFITVPFPLNFNVYIFSVLNPEEVQSGAKPRLKEIGPFCYEEWKTKINVQDFEGDDTVAYDPVDTFFKATGPKCVNGDTEVTVPHPMILGLVNTVLRQKPGALTLANKAIKSIWSDPTSMFITVKARELLFDGIIINCGVSDFAGKAICTNLRAEPSLKAINEEELAFSLLGPKNATPGKRIRAFRGIQDFHHVGKIVTFDGKSQMEVWNSSKCDAIIGTDGTIFPPLGKKEEAIWSFAPDICRSLPAVFEKKTKYDQIPVGSFTASLGDASKNPDEKCFCTNPDTCLKKGLMDLYKCTKIPLYASLPHFYDSDASYVNGVRGLKPVAEKHEIRILFETMTGSPLHARKRLQFSMPLEPNAKVDLFHNFTTTVFPLFWIEEGVDLNKTYTKPIKNLFMVKKAVGAIKVIFLIGSLAALGAAGYLYYTTDNSIIRTTIQKVRPDENGSANNINTILNGNQLEGRLNESFDHKY